VVLRLAFHDAATYDAAAGDGGANASVRLELERPENRGLRRGWRVIETAMAGGPRFHSQIMSRWNQPCGCSISLSIWVRHSMLPCPWSRTLT